MATYVYVGGHTRARPFRGDPRPARGEGIEVYRLAADESSLTHLQTVALSPDPTYLHVSASRGMLYAAIHSSVFCGRRGSAVVAFRIDDRTGCLTDPHHRPIPAPHAAHVALDRSEALAFVTSSVGGGVSVVRLEPGGGLGPLSDEIRHPGALMQVGSAATFPAVIRRGPPFPHCAVPDLENRFALVADLGRNRVVAHRLDVARGRLARDATDVELHPGAGPRALALHPDGGTVYTANEDDSTVSVLEYESSSGALHEVQHVRTLPRTFAGRSSGGAIELHPSGRFLLASNRGHDSVALLAMDAAGRLRLVAIEPSGGRHPRHLAVAPGGRVAFVANTHTDGVAALSVDTTAGTLRWTRAVTSVAAPTCVAFYRPAARPSSSISGTPSASAPCANL